jgi:hypothetical protein
LNFDFSQGKYRKWAEENNFKSRLPGDIRRCKAAAAELVVRTLDCNLVEKKITERIVKYTDQSFCQAAIEWLIATDQVRSTILISSYYANNSTCSRYVPLNILNSKK